MRRTHQVNRIRSNRGGEFIDMVIVEYCDYNGYKHEFSAPKTPQQNGVAERKKRTLQEMARVMLHAKSLPMYFWVESIITACHIINRVYLRKNTKQTSYELWYGKKPNLKYLRTFGSRCYVCKDREHLSKFETRGDKAIFLGYSPNSHAYRIYNLSTKTLMESINVIVSDTIVENKISESPIVVESENDFKNDSPEIDDSLPIESPEVPGLGL